MLILKNEQFIDISLETKRKKSSDLSLQSLTPGKFVNRIFRNYFLGISSSLDSYFHSTNSSTIMSIKWGFVSDSPLIDFTCVAICSKVTHMAYHASFEVP